MIVTWNPDAWLAARALPLADRIAPAGVEAVSYVAQFNAAQGMPGRPESAAVPDDLAADVRAALAELPAAVQAKLATPLLGVHFARGLGSSGITDVVADAYGTILGSVTLLDVDTVMQRSANAWATWKENTPFAPAAGLRLDATVERPADDDRKQALQYLLLHEFGHVLTAGSGLLPDWWLAPNKFRPTDEYGFLRLSWQIAADGRIVPREHEDFPQRARLAYYSDAQLPGTALPEAYAALARTGFVTLYAATNAYDDFAESFATYVHVVLQGKPFEIRLLRDGEVVCRNDAFWSSARAAAKRQLLADFLGA